MDEATVDRRRWWAVFALLPARAIPEGDEHVDGLATFTFAEAEGELELAGELS
jgi:hypothetical protein